MSSCENDHSSAETSSTGELLFGCICLDDGLGGVFVMSVAEFDLGGVNWDEYGIGVGVWEIWDCVLYFVQRRRECNVLPGDDAIVLLAVLMLLAVCAGAYRFFLSNSQFVARAIFWKRLQSALCCV